MILDTNAVSALLVGEPSLAEVLAASVRHELPVVVLGEYRFGLRRSTRRKRLEALFERLVKECRVLPINETTASVYAEVRDSLRQRGTPIPENDVWIAAICIEHQVPLATSDAHFSGIDELSLISR